MFRVGRCLRFPLLLLLLVPNGYLLLAPAANTPHSLEEHQEALNKLLEDLSRFRNSGELIAAARTQNEIGLLRLRLNTPQLAIEAFNDALSITQTHPATEVEVDSLNGLAAANLTLKKMDQVEPWLKRSLELAEPAQYLAGKARALVTLSEWKNFTDHVRALEIAEESLQIWDGLNDNNGRAGAYGQIGRCLMAQSRLAEATEKYKVALGLWRNENNKSSQAEALIMLGFIEARQAEWQTAIDYFTEAQTLIDERVEFRKMGQIAAGLADAFTDNGMPEEGLTHFQRALTFYQQTGDPRSIRSVMLTIGSTHYVMGNYVEASKYFEEVLNQVPPDSLDATHSYVYLGRIALETQEYSKALMMLQRALPIFEKAGNPKEAAQVNGLIGQVYERQGSLTAARQKYREALSTFERLTDRIHQSLMYYTLGRMELKAGTLDAAEDYLNKSIQTTESIRTAPASTDLAATFSATVHERYQTYIDCLMRLHKEKPDQGFSVKAFETSELARARSLVDLLRTMQMKQVQGVDTKLAEQERALSRAIQMKEDNRIALLKGDYKQEQLEAINRELSSLESEYANVLTTIQTRYPAYRSIIQPTVWPLAQIQEQVIRDDQTLLLEYSLGEERSYLWVVGRKEFSAYELPGRAQIEESASQFRKLLVAHEPLAGQTFEEWQARVAAAAKEIEPVSSALGDLILGPVLNKLGNKRLLIVADGRLQTIPFQALMVPPHNSESAAVWNASGTSNTSRVPLIVDHEIVNEPSAVALGLVINETGLQVSPSKSVAIFANPVFEANDPRVQPAGSSPPQQTSYAAIVRKAFRNVGSDGSIPPLPASREEADAIVSVAPWRSVLKAVDFDASRSTILATDLGQFSVVHFATHAFVKYEHPESSGLVLSLVDRKGQPQKGLFDLRDIYNLRLPVRLVVLSACNTALGKEIKGEGLIGLTRGFMHSGARAVASSLWKVEDDATAELMKRFYDGMFLEELTPAASLRRAQISMWEQKRWRAPYYWAAFTIQGEYDQKIPLPTGPSFFGIALIMLAAGSVLVMTIFLFRRRRKRTLLGRMGH